jgi:hypothetical protein
MWTADTAAAIRRGTLQRHSQRLTDELLQVCVPCVLLAARSLLQGLPRLAQHANALPTLAARCPQTQVVTRVRGQLSTLDRKVLSALIVIDVHARDVAVELATKGVSSEADFDFVSQLRWERSGAGPAMLI